jgi:hypothetical protein
MPAIIFVVGEVFNRTGTLRGFKWAGGQMSIGIYATGMMVRRQRFLSAKPSAGAFAETLRNWLDRRCEHLRFRPTVVTQEGDCFHIVAFVHPAGGEIVIRLDAGNRLTLESTTNPVGPGFHAFVCDVVDGISNDMTVKWSSVEDDIEFMEHRDFSRLQGEMTNWLQHLAVTCVDRMSDHTNLALAMPLGGQPKLQHGMISMPSGPRPWNWLRSVARKESDGREFFAWWGREWRVDERVGWLNAALWNLTSFEKPQNQEEADTQELVLRHASKLLSDGIDVGPVAADLADLSRAEGGTHAYLFDVQSGNGTIGYRRLPTTHAISGGWSITIPGHFAITVEDNTWIAYDNDRTVRFSSYHIASDDSPERFLETLPVSSGFETLPLDTRDDTVYRVSYGQGTPEDGCDWVIRCEAVNLPHLGSLTIAVKSSHRSWAIEVPNSLRFTRREQDL